MEHVESLKTTTHDCLEFPFEAPSKLSLMNWGGMDHGSLEEDLGFLRGHLKEFM